MHLLLQQFILSGFLISNSHQSLFVDVSNLVYLKLYICG